MDENHFIEIVDEFDNIVGRASREEKFEKELISRIVVAFVLNSKGELVVVKRSPHKKSWPNRLDLATCGNVNEGETYREAIKREIKEEIGISCRIRFLKKIFTNVEENGKRRKYFTAIFLGKTDKEPVLGDELLELRYIKPTALGKQMKDEPGKFSPSFIEEFDLVKGLLK